MQSIFFKAVVTHTGKNVKGFLKYSQFVFFLVLLRIPDRQQLFSYILGANV